MNQNKCYRCHTPTDINGMCANGACVLNSPLNTPSCKNRMGGMGGCNDHDCLRCNPSPEKQEWICALCAQKRTGERCVECGIGKFVITQPKHSEEGWENEFEIMVFNGVPCDKILGFVKSLLASSQSKLLKTIVEKLDGIDTKEHICGFNDGEQNCDCYIEALNQVKDMVKSLIK